MKKLRQRGPSTKNCKYFNYPGCQCYLKQTPPPYSVSIYGL